MWDTILDLIFPPRCVSCGKFGCYFCAVCLEDIRYFSPQLCPYCDKESSFGLTHKSCQKVYGLDGLFVLGHYTGSLKRLIKKVKYQGVWKGLPEIAPVVARYYHHKFNFNFLIPVPLSKSRESSRGFNQAAILAKSLQKNLGENVSVADVLKRTRNTKPQFELKFSERKQNVSNAFALRDAVIPGKISGESFCLIDDVATTGSTLFECARVLKSHSAANVFAITIARGS